MRFSALAAELLKSADTLVPRWLAGGRRIGHEWVCGSLAGGEGRSCSVNLATGAWADFSSDERGGDLLSLYAAIHDLSMAKACLELARDEGLEDVAGVVKGVNAAAPPRPPRPAPPPKAPAQPPREGWRAVVPVPAFAPPVNYLHQHRAEADIVHVSEYRCEGALYGYVVRFKTSDGGKDDIACTWCESTERGGARWHWKQWEAPRPLYLPGGALPKGRTVVLVEGERKGDVLQALLDAHAPGVYCVAGWPGGCKAWQKADWSWLAGSTVIAWPDCDSKRVQPTVAERKALPAGDAAALQALKDSKPYLSAAEQPGMKAMLGIGAHLRDVHGCTVSVLPIEPPGVLPDGWDARDAIETDGWTAERVLEFFGRAQPCPSALAPASAPAAPPDKKNEGPVDTGGGDDAGLRPGLVRCGSHWVPEWLSWYFDQDKLRWNVSRKTVIAVLERAEEFADAVAYDEMRNVAVCRRPLPWAPERTGELRDADALLLGKWLSDTWDLPSVSQAALHEALQTVAHAQRYHPVRDWLQALRWDGKTRIDKWLLYVLGERPDNVPPALAEYLCLVGRYWLLGMVNRVMQPGCKFDYCPVLEGSGGLRKSTLVEVLAGSEHYSDTPFQVGQGKEGQEQVQGCWLYEIAELTNFSKSEVGAIKVFVSSKVDRYRVAYGTVVESFPRQCVLVGTTNEDTYLRDRTGNRRFWPIPVHQVINTDWVLKWRDQLLAEAYALYLQGAPYTPTPDQEKRLFSPMQESRMVETAVDSELLAVLTRAPNPNASGPMAVVHKEATFLTISQLVQALGVDAAKAPPGLQGQVTGWLKREGWQRVKRQINGVRAWGYQRPAKWPTQDVDSGLDQPSDATEQPDLDAPAPAPAPLSVAATYMAQMEGEDDPF